MSKALTDLGEMQVIYETSKAVYEGEYSVQYALLSLSGKVAGTPSSLKMYFHIYACMRNGKCYKMGTSESFTRFLLVSIYKDFGKEAFIKALSAVKANSAYRDSVKNSQPGLTRACLSAISDCAVDVEYDKIPAAPIDMTNNKSDKRNAISSASSIKSASNSAEIANDIPVNELQKSEESDVFELNIQPAASILNVFSRLSYKPWYAIAEFVDNSTQSYISHAEELNAAPGFDKLIVWVKYDANANTLTITDNAYGMEMERFRDAILLDSRNSQQTGRNEFGMGLKTAASWFGNVWSVTSTQYGSTNRYSATVDIPRLKETGLNSIRIHRDHVEAKSHGTQIVIEQVTKKITGSRTIGKIRDLLSSMYRRDINNRNIEIWFGDEPIVFEEYPVLTNFRGKRWKKELDFEVLFEDVKYRVSGFVAIMNPGSFPKAGFSLFRQDRVVVGGTDSNYKPTQIFGQAQSQRSLKLFGELNMNDFPVNQAKDGFIWDDGLEDAFIEVLKNNIQEYIEIAEMSIKERANEMQYSEQASNELQQDVANALNQAFSNDNAEVTSGNTEPDESPVDSHSGNPQSTKSDIQEYIDTVLNEDIMSTYAVAMQQIENNELNNNMLLVGKVQSGKTSNLELFTALAFDNGFNLVVIYGGYDNTLLAQTTTRFKKTFDIPAETDYSNDTPVVFSSDDSAQLLTVDDEIIEDLLEANKPIFLISMKRPAAMNKVNDLLARIDKGNLRAFIIDDEGDQASLNTKKNKAADASATYAAIVAMKGHLDDPLYLSVTATPQALIFLDEYSMLRPDSIMVLDSASHRAYLLCLTDQEVLPCRELASLMPIEAPSSFSRGQRRLHVV